MNLPDCVQYKNNFIDTSKHPNILLKLLQEVKFNSDEESSILMYGKRIPIPRKQCAYGDDGTSYKFSGITVKPNNWNDSPTLMFIKKDLEKKLKLEFNFCLVNYYKDGKNYIGYHSDDEKDLDSKYPIASLSFGETRIFKLKSKSDGSIYDVPLKDNSIILMNPPCQSTYQHSIAKTAKKIGGRINLTFRKIK